MYYKWFFFSHKNMPAISVDFSISLSLHEVSLHEVSQLPTWQSVLTVLIKETDSKKVSDFTWSNAEMAQSKAESFGFRSNILYIQPSWPPGLYTHSPPGPGWPPWALDRSCDTTASVPWHSHGTTEMVSVNVRIPVMLRSMSLACLSSSSRRFWFPRSHRGESTQVFLLTIIQSFHLLHV